MTWTLCCRDCRGARADVEGPAAGGLLVHKGSDGGLDERSREVMGIDWMSCLWVYSQWDGTREYRRGHRRLPPVITALLVRQTSQIVNYTVFWGEPRTLDSPPCHPFPRTKWFVNKFLSGARW